ncbi:MAG: EFR1 family ferrodoxin [Acidaminococcaceae bacterium]
MTIMAVIFYFSGTGNSLSVANKLGKELGARVEGISAYLRSPYAIEDEVLGFVTPVYCFALPSVVKAFLLNAQIKGPQYLFGVATMGAIAGQTLNQAERILAGRAIKMHAGFKLALPDSSIVFPSPAKRKEEMLQTEEEKVAKIVAAVKRHEENEQRSNFLFAGDLVENVGWWVMKNIYKIDHKHADEDSCIGCGLCAKICPMSCIEMKDEYPVFGENCANCFACAQWCPQNAIRLGKLVAGQKTKYVHPGITVGQMLLQKK